MQVAEDIEAMVAAATMCRITQGCARGCKQSSEVIGALLEHLQKNFDDSAYPEALGSRFCRRAHSCRQLRTEHGDASEFEAEASKLEAILAKAELFERRYPAASFDIRFSCFKKAV